MIVKPHYTQNFTIVPNSIIRDSNLSLQAIGLCAYVLSLPKEWKINIEQVCLALDISKNTAYKYLKELIQAGVLKKVRLQDEQGKFTNEAIYFVCDDRENEGENIPTPLPKICEMVESNKTQTKALKSDILTTSQNLNTINKDSKDKKRESKKKAQTQFYILQSLEQKRLLALCFAKEPKPTQLDTSALSVCEKEAFERFLSYRKQKHRLTLATQKAILERFLKAKQMGATTQDIQKAVDKSIMQGWQGLFIKQAKNPSQKAKSPQAVSDEILQALLLEYPNFDFSNVNEFLQTHLLKGRKVKYENSLFSWDSKKAVAQ